MASNRNGLKIKNGYSLIELIVAIGLISVLIAGFAWLFADAIHFNQDVVLQNKALNYAKTKIENLRVLSYTEIAALQDPTNTNTQLGSENLSDLHSGQLTTQINNWGDPSYAIKEIEVVVFWNNSRENQENINLTTLISQKGLND